MTDGEKMIFAAVYADELRRANDYVNKHKAPTGGSTVLLSDDITHGGSPWDQAAPAVPWNNRSEWCAFHAWGAAWNAVVNGRAQAQTQVDLSPTAYVDYAEIFEVTEPE